MLMGPTLIYMIEAGKGGCKAPYALLNMYSVIGKFSIDLI